MRLRQICEAYVRPDVEGTTVTAYHCGNKFDGDFDLNRSGQGEGYRILGPGMYFITDKGIAQNYLKYAKTEQAMMVTCEIKLDNFYDCASAPTPHMIECMDNLAKHLGYPDRKAMPRNSDSLRNGRGFIGDVVKHVGHKMAQKLFLKFGINGALEHINPAWEIAVFNLACVKITDRETMENPYHIGDDDF